MKFGPSVGLTMTVISVQTRHLLLVVQQISRERLRSSSPTSYFHSRTTLLWTPTHDSADEEDITAGNMGAAFVDVDNGDEWMEWLERWVEP